MENKKTKIISVVSIIGLALTLVTATYAYFAAQTGEGAQTDIKINASTVDTLTFETGSAISLSLDQDNFASGKGNQSGTTFAKAMLSANNKTNTATERYYMYLNINENTFTYTQDEGTPEILLTITDTNNNEITSINGLTYKTVTDGNGTTLKGFDITNHSGLITIFDNREITTTSSITEEWNIVVTYVNYNFNQSSNAGKGFSASIMIQKNQIITNITNVCETGNNLKSCLTTLGSNGTLEYTNLYYHDSTQTNGAGDSSYRYAGGDYFLTELGKSLGATSINKSDNTVTNALIDFYCNGTKQIFGNYCSPSYPKYYLIKNDTTEYQTYNEAFKSAMIKGYLKNDEVKNFVCFGSDEKPCLMDNLYRIIGVINDKVKLIKYDYATSDLLGTDGDYIYSSTPSATIFNYKGSLTSIDKYYWNYKTANNASNEWSTSLLNKINLNTNFLNNIGEEWANKIATTTWKVGGNTSTNIEYSIPSIVYQNEIVAPAENTTNDAKIGLMYVSDYGFAVSPSAWTQTMSSYSSAKNNSWMYMGLSEWTITRRIDGSIPVFIVEYGSSVYYYNVSYGMAVRPVFNLVPTVTYVSGSGTQSDPIRIN